MQEKVKFRVGNSVRLPTKRPMNWDRNGCMDKYLKTIQTIVSIERNSFRFKGDDFWNFSLDEVVLENPFKYHITKK